MSDILLINTNTITTQIDMTSNTEIYLMTLDNVNNPITSTDTQYIEVNDLMCIDSSKETVEQNGVFSPGPEEPILTNPIDEIQQLTMNHLIHTQQVDIHMQYVNLINKIEEQSAPLINTF